MKRILLSLLMLSGAAFGDAWDSGDDIISGATELTISGSLSEHGPHTLTNEVDLADWFRFDLQAGKRYRFESVGFSDTAATLYEDEAGSMVVASDDDHGESFNFQLLFVPETSGTYYLEVIDAIAGEGSSASYQLNYLEEPLADAWDTADDFYDTAPTLELLPQEQLHGPHSLGATDTVDWFHFYLIAGIEYTFSAENFGWDTVGTLYYEGASPVANGDDEGTGDNKLNFIITFTPTTTGDYHLKVQGFDEGSTLNYDLKYFISGNSDADGDGMLDTWEIAYLGGTNALPGAHADADAQSNLEEYIAGTDPTNSASFFAVTNHTVGSFVVGWPAAAGREYRVYWTDSLTNGFAQIGPVIDFPQNSYTDTAHNAESSGFYKVDVQLK